MRLNPDILIATVNQIKIWHWQTRIPEHEIFGELYDSLSGIIDRFIEVSLGVNGNRDIATPLRFELDAFKSVEMSIKHLSAFRSFLQVKLLDKNSSTDQQQLRDDMLEAVNLAIYKLLPQ